MDSDDMALVDSKKMISDLLNISQIVDSYPDKEFASPSRSTVALLSWLKDSGRVEATLNRCGLVRPEEYHFEYTASPLYKKQDEHGRGKSSCTDLMVVGAGGVLAIEAKWREPKYPTVGKWLDDPNGDKLNRLKVLKGWINRLVLEDADIDLTRYSEIVYQLLHRAASAVKAAGSDKTPGMAMIVFSLEGDAGQDINEYKEQLLKLKKAPGMGKVGVFLIEVRMKSVGYERIKDKIKGVAETAVDVKRELQGKRKLFEFEHEIVTEIAAQ